MKEHAPRRSRTTLRISASALLLTLTAAALTAPAAAQDGLTADLPDAFAVDTSDRTDLPFDAGVVALTDPARIEFDAPIIRESVAEMVVRRILDMVKAGVLKAGDALKLEGESQLTLSQGQQAEVLVFDLGA